MLYNLPFMSGFAHQKYLNAEEGLIEAIKYGCTHWYIDGSLHGEMVDEWSRKRINDFKSMLLTYKCNPIFHGNFKIPLASDVDVIAKLARDYTKREIDFCAELNAPLVIHAGAIVEPKKIVEAKKIALEHYLQSILELGTYAKQHGVELYLENLSNYKHYRPFHYIFTNYNEYAYIFENTKSLDNIFFFFDVGHSMIGNEDTMQVIIDFHDQIKGISLSNNNGQHDQHLPLGKGDFNYHEFIKTILNLKWHGIVAFETRGISTTQTLQELMCLYQSVCNEQNTCQ